MKSINESNGVDKKNLVKVQEDQFIEEFLPQVVCTNANCEVVDKQGNVKGYITNKELQKSLTKSQLMADQSLKNKKIIISAGASGIGLATAKVCLLRGATVYLCDLNEKFINRLKKHSQRIWHKKTF